MAQENRYPSPEPSNPIHPYPNSNQPPATNVEPHMQPAPTAMMSEPHGNQHSVSQGIYELSQFTAQPSTPQQLAQQGLDVDGGASTDKKKTKVSRACDECRRKKVRCDAETDQPGTQCGNCRRTNATCQFSRQPQKRGPSKGYIKELAERVNRLESTGTGAPFQPEIQYSPMNHGLQNQERDYSPQVDFRAPDQQRKRTHSMAEGTPRYSEGPEQMQDYPSRAFFPSSSQAVVNLAHAPTHGLPQTSGLPISNVDQAILAGYYKHIHSILPLLPEDTAELTSMLNAISADARSGFVAALTVAVRGATNAITEADIRRAADACPALLGRHDKTPTVSYNLVQVQTLVFLAIAEQYAGPIVSRSGGRLAAAIALAKTLHLRDHRRPETPSRSELTNLLRRSRLCLIILDRWHAAAICESTHIPSSHVQIDPSDHILLGSSSYHLLRISLALGHLTNTFLQPLSLPNISAPSNDPHAEIKELMRGETSRIDESINPLFATHPFIHLSFLYLRMISDKATENLPGFGDKPAIDAALEAGGLLRSGKFLPTCPSPLDHHVVSLSIAVLGQALAQDVSGSVQALMELRAWCQGGGNTRLAPSWKEPIVTLIANVLERGGLVAKDDEEVEALQELADAAIGRGGNDGRNGWRVIVDRGYLSLFE